MRLAAITLVLWVFGIAPVLCVSGVLAHCCDCEDLAACTPDSCPRGHGCHSDPCRVNAARQTSTDIDDIPVHPGDMLVACFTVGSDELIIAPGVAAVTPSNDAPVLDAFPAVNPPLIV